MATHRQSEDCQICEICNVIVQPANALAAHAASESHVERAQGNFVSCTTCSRSMPRGGWNGHINGASHRTAAERQGIRSDLPPQIPSAVDGHKKCKICNVFVKEGMEEAHERGAIHRKQVAAHQQVADLQALLGRAYADKHGVTVSHPDGLDMGILELGTSGRSEQSYLAITTSRTNIKFIQAETWASDSPVPSNQFAVKSQSTSSIIVPGYEFQLVIECKLDASTVGRYSGKIQILFEDSSVPRRFYIARQVTVVVADSVDHQAIAPTAPYQPRSRRARDRLAPRKIISGPRLYRVNPYKVLLALYPIPDVLSEALEHGPQDVGSTVKRLPPDFQPDVLTAENYIKIMSARLWTEEHRAKLDMQAYDMFNERLDKRGHTFYLRVPGLAENRPSIVLGDVVLLQRTGDMESVWSEGIVYHVLSEELGLRFAPSFKPSSTITYSVRFEFNRIPLRRQHQALNCPFAEARVLFPCARHVKNGSTVENALKLFNSNIDRNPAQLLAVKTILALPHGAHPFVVYGPPGTGKTVTIVEAIVQLLRRDPSIRILACAPSNSAADIIAIRLRQFVEYSELCRVYAPSRSLQKTPNEKLFCTNKSKDGTAFAVPSMDKICNHNIIVATCVGTSFAHNIKMPAGYFDWIFVDEAGQGSEPEAMVSIKGMGGPRTNFVLSGDPKQLGPVIRSGIAVELGLGKSFLERLMERVVYDEKEYHGRTIVKLVHNFRSHPRILEFPNNTFYGGDLQACASHQIVNVFQEWKHHPRPKRKFPIIFHALAGKDEREASSPSYFNRLEAMQVKSYVKMLLAGGLAAREIGVITPYHAQASKIQQLLAALQPGIAKDEQSRVASVELFQGEERKVIIMSTVRSTEDLVGHDLKHTLGFVGNPRRFNVAMTRAQALLIVVGDPAILGMDPLWRSWLNWVYQCGGWTGSKGPAWDTKLEVQASGTYELELQDLVLQQMRQLTEHMQAVDLGDLEGDLDARAWEMDARDTE